uniref:Protein MAK10 homolog n=1 Tax=Homalodisca liturata TaxID=320908 RepID=A0A1B6I0N4_9HEMI
MSAIEMMDPKMDAGMLCNRGNKTALTFEQAVESGKLRLSGLTVTEQIGLIDSTVACFVSWLEGHSLAQTVFTNLYMHKPHTIQDKPLRAFCFSIYKVVYIIKEFVNRGLVFEEEDFQPTVYGYSLCPDISEQRVVALLRETEDDLSRKIRAKPTDSPSTGEHEDLVALHARMRFTRLFYQALSSLSKQSNVSDSSKLLSNCAEVIPTLVKSLDRGLQPSPSNDPHSGGTVMLGFEPLVNQRLLPPTFPRYTRIKSRAQAYQYIEELIGRLKQACRVSGCSSFHNALDLFIELSRSNPCIVSRSVMQLLYMNRPNSCVEALRDAARTFISPPSLAPRNPFVTLAQGRELVDTFFDRCVRPFTNLIQLCGHNRARQRDKLAHLLEEFAALQDEAERADNVLNGIGLKCEPQRSHLACFGTWVLYHNLRIMIMFLLSGFELELYSTHEYHYIFWYLYEFLYGWLISSLTRADTFLVDQEQVVNARVRRNKPRKKKTRPYTREIVFHQALQNMCGGYYKAMLGFRQDGKLPLPHPEFDCERVRYEHRFAPFSGLVTPPPVQYQEFHDVTLTLQHSPSQNLYTHGCKHFHQARTLLESITNPDTEINELLRVTKTNFVVLKLLATGHKRESSNPPEFDFSYHHHFPIIKIH